MQFNFESPAHIIFGAGRIQELPQHIRSFGSRCLLITGSSITRYEHIINLLKESGVAVHTFCVEDEPSIALVDSVTSFARESAIEFVVGLGGGSVLDTAKAVSIMLTHTGSVKEYLEGIGSGTPLTNPSLPCIAIPTTAGTGSEVTKNAVLFSEEDAIKVSLRSELMMPTLALVDPELTFSLPAKVTAYTGMDALTQVIEPFLSCMSNELTDTLCRDAIAKGGPALLKAFHEPTNSQARTDMAYVSLMGGLALANAKLGAVHGFAGPIGGMFKAPHGALCAALLPHVLEANIKAVCTRGTELQLKRYEELALLLTRNPLAEAEDSVGYLKKLITSLGIPSLCEYDISLGSIDAIVAASKDTSSMKGNTLPLTEDELKKVLFKAL